MSEKIAVHCETKEEWIKVQGKAFGRIRTSIFAGADCINPASTWASKRHYQGEGYTIISAQEYLKEDEFKVGGKVIFLHADGFESNCGNYTGGLKLGDTYMISKARDGGVKVEGDTWWHDKRHFTVTPNFDQTKTIKEEAMNINDNVLEVFKEDAVMAGKISKRFGSQYGTIDRDTLALKRDKKDLLAIIKKEEAEEKE